MVSVKGGRVLTSFSSFPVFPSSTSPLVSSLDFNVSSISKSFSFSSRFDDESSPLKKKFFLEPLIPWSKT